MMSEPAVKAVTENLLKLGINTMPGVKAQPRNVLQVGKRLTIQNRLAIIRR
ncbi:hypothetical protein Pcar_3284 [Syntrophotalea carbinolica DSM 2380]|uniref:Uncharacterized protein n=1 Tax=Syntrophotalea carbinolica (strain DSM 2380 / NBRC 103641 / GraBd1) TaxID=338963 RepID=Q0C6N4_SYNC1|nr:hypothetical protein Pcar_3284 [Syntrophotalea carbinolica DSM 2380]